MNKLLSLVAVLPLSFGLFSTACADDASCDDDQVLEQGNCIDKASGGAPGSGGSTASDAGGEAAPPEAGPACEGPAAAFGDPCSDGTNHTDCGCPADYCAVQPGTSTGFCTRTGCLEDPSVCPADWTCLDLSNFSAGLPSICVAPTR